MFWRSRWRPLMRLINRCELERAWRCRLPEIRPHSRPIGEMVHWSALARWEETKAARRWQRYQPRNLLAALKSVQENKTPVVGLDGEPTSLLGLYKRGNADAAERAARAERHRRAERGARCDGGANGASGGATCGRPGDHAIAAGGVRSLARAGCRPHPLGRDTRPTRPLISSSRLAARA